MAEHRRISGSDSTIVLYEPNAMRAKKIDAASRDIGSDLAIARMLLFCKRKMQYHTRILIRSRLTKLCMILVCACKKSTSLVKENEK